MNNPATQAAVALAWCDAHDIKLSIHEMEQRIATSYAPLIAHARGLAEAVLLHTINTSPLSKQARALLDMLPEEK